MARCIIAPAGWACTRDAGHAGPCAAVVAVEPGVVAVLEFRDGLGRRHLLANDPRPVLISSSEGPPHSYPASLSTEIGYTLAVHYVPGPAFSFEFRQREIRDRVAAFLLSTTD